MLTLPAQRPESGSPLTLISAKVLVGVDTLRREFGQGAPFRHLVIDDFLARDFADQLLAEFPVFESGNSVGDDGKQGIKSTVEDMRLIGPAYQALDKLVQTAGFLGFIGTITGIEKLLYDPFYLGGGTHENRDGQSLQAHVDFNYHPTERWHRRLNLIVYLNPRWEQAWGGNLGLFADPYCDVTPAMQITPAFNRCVLFETTENSWHGFDRIALPAAFSTISRKSVALYFYSKDRPAAEVAGKHTTHYVNRQLPDTFVEGYRLTEADVKLLRELIGYRDGQLRELYLENSRLLQAQERGLTGQVLYLLKRLYVRYRR